MNNSYTSDGISTLAYDITFIVGFVLLILLITVSCYVCSRAERREQQNRLRSVQFMGQLPAQRGEPGIDEVALSACPKVAYSQAKLQTGADSIGPSCAICLVDYKESDVLRLLPRCGHLFHVKCVDPWLRMHATCPICRNSPVPEP